MLDLFAGAGGTGLGFQRAGYIIAGAVEIDQYAAQTYKQNLGTEVVRTDIREIDIPRFRKQLGLKVGELDVLVGCPPCQGFSRMRNGGGIGDERNSLILKYIEFIDAFQPRFALFENVPGLVRTQHGKEFYDAMREGLRCLGYGFWERKVNAADYGVPQRRERVIVITGRNHEIPPPMPLPTHTSETTQLMLEGFRKPWMTVRDAIENFPLPTSAMDLSEPALPNHVVARTSDETIAFIKRVPKDGGSRTDVPREFWLPCHLKHDGHKDVFGRLRWDRVAGTMTSGCNNASKGRFVHPEQDRPLTVREAAALQGFPNDYVFSPQKAPLQVGNAVPPPLAQVLAEVLLERLHPKRSK